MAYVFLACLCWYAYTCTRGIGATIYSDACHTFRQAQCALTIRSMATTGRNELPALGKPWVLPFEFPLYQWLAALLTRAFKATGALKGFDQIAVAGRSVSIAFHLLTLLPLWIVCGPLGLSHDAAWAIGCLWLVSPFYAFWSRTVMIESTAVFLCSMMAAGMIHGGTGWVVAGAVCGCLGALVKVTTWPPYFLAVLAWEAVKWWA